MSLRSWSQRWLTRLPVRRLPTWAVQAERRPAAARCCSVRLNSSARRRRRPGRRRRCRRRRARRRRRRRPHRRRRRLRDSVLDAARRRQAGRVAFQPPQYRLRISSAAGSAGRLVVVFSCRSGPVPRRVVRGAGRRSYPARVHLGGAVDGHPTVGKQWVDLQFVLSGEYKPPTLSCCRRLPTGAGAAAAAERAVAAVASAPPSPPPRCRACRCRRRLHRRRRAPPSPPPPPLPPRTAP